LLLTGVDVLGGVRAEAPSVMSMKKIIREGIRQKNDWILCGEEH
jgi:hypothetical protein